MGSHTIVAGILSGALILTVVPAVDRVAPVVTVSEDQLTSTEIEIVVPDGVAQSVDGGEPADPDVPDALIADPATAIDAVAEEVAPLDVVDEQDLAASPALELPEPIQTIGLTWPMGEETPSLQVRARDLDGTWGEWFELEQDNVVPDAGTAEAELARAGTSSIWVGDSDAVQVATVGRADQAVAASDVRLALVGSAEPVSANASPASAVFTAPPASVVMTAVPTSVVATGVPFNVIPRSAWGARTPTCTMDSVSKLDGAVVHHTAGGNSYTTQTQAMQQIRNDQWYHMNTRGWCDLGYNFVIDKWGTIYEGRAGSLDSNVIGVHASNYNTGTVGVSFLGNYDVVDLPSAAVNAAGRVIGYKLGISGVSPTATVTYRNTGARLPAVIAHRDVAATACPGRYAYPKLDAIRAAGVQWWESQTPVFRALTTALYRDLLGRSPEPAGLSFWTARMMAGSSQADLVRDITNSQEYATIRVREAYRDVLGRNGEAAGVGDWVNRVMTGAIAVDDVQFAFYKEREFYLVAGGTPERFAQHLYRVMLDRNASAQEVSMRAGQVSTLGVPRIVSDVWWSVEAAQARSSRYYPLFLGRTVDPTGRVFWGNVLLRDGEGAVRIGIAGSDEYRARAVQRYGGSSA